MPFIKQVKIPDRTQVKITVSKTVADEFNKELEIYQQNNSANHTLDFDSLFRKLTRELAKLNFENK